MRTRVITWAQFCDEYGKRECRETFSLSRHTVHRRYKSDRWFVEVENGEPVAHWKRLKVGEKLEGRS